MGLFHSDDGYISPFDATETKSAETQPVETQPVETKSAETVDTAFAGKTDDDASADKPYYVPNAPKTEYTFRTTKTLKNRNKKTETRIFTLLPPPGTRSENAFRGIGIAVLIMVIFALIVTVISRSNMYASKHNVYSRVSDEKTVIMEPASDDMPTGEQTGTLNPGDMWEADISILEARVGPQFPCGATLRIRYKVRVKGTRSLMLSDKTLGVFQDGRELLAMDMRHLPEPSPLIMVPEIPASATTAITVTYALRNTTSGIDVAIRESDGTIRAKTAFLFTDSTRNGAMLRRVAHSSLPKSPAADPSSMKEPVTLIAHDRKYTLSVEPVIREYVRGKPLATMTIHWFVEWTVQPHNLDELYPTILQNGKKLHMDRYIKQKSPSAAHSDRLRVYPNTMMTTIFEFELEDLSAPVRLRLNKSFEEILWEGDFEHHLHKNSIEDESHTV